LILPARRRADLFLNREFKRPTMKALLKTALTALALGYSCSAIHAQENAPQPHESSSAASICPRFGWAEGLNFFLKPDTPFPVNDTQNLHSTDCDFQQWSAEAFVWATALNVNSVPRFMTFPTPEDLLATGSESPPPRDKPRLKLAARSSSSFGDADFTEGAGAIVQADGNMLVAPNGYPVYASVHMNPSYFATAKLNLVATGGYCNQPSGSYFNVGDAVFKATWLRLGDNEQPPAGAYVTQAEVPVLRVLRTKSNYTVIPSGNFVTTRVALVGLHVVGYTVNHPEFLWATFEHKLNSPRAADYTFSTSGSDPKSFTFYAGGTPFSQVNIPNPNNGVSKPQLTFDLMTQKFAPSSNAVLENKFGGALFPDAAQAQSDIGNVNSAFQGVLKKLPAQAAFANYDLIGTLWLSPNSYVDPVSQNMTNNLQNFGVGSVNLANTTAETFEQCPPGPNNVGNADQCKARDPKTNLLTNAGNCFMCHNPQAPSITPITVNPPTYCNGTNNFPNRRVSISHVLEIGTPAAVPNSLVVPLTR
jgi:hypothetical protein